MVNMKQHSSLLVDASKDQMCVSFSIRFVSRTMPTFLTMLVKHELLMAGTLVSDKVRSF